MIVSTYSATLRGLIAYQVVAEVDSTRGKPGLSIIGLPEKAIEEAKERLSSALANCGVRLKAKKTLVNLAPADLPKTGSHLELALAVALWQLTNEKVYATKNDIFFGELALDGSIRRVRGALPLVNFARQSGFARVFVPAENVGEVQVLTGIAIYPVNHLCQVLDFLAGKSKLAPLCHSTYQAQQSNCPSDFAQIIGQAAAKRCLEIAAAGGHNLLLTGVPGAGKSLLASALPGILPPLTRQEALELTTIYSVSGMLPENQLIKLRPCRSPHHSISAIGLVGGGQKLLPGEISLAHQGILFLDELGEFRRDSLEMLRQPLETGNITIVRSAGRVVYPARFTLVAATNPCPCGFYGSKKKECTCSPQAIRHYRQKLSGPILDRLDLQIFVPEVEVAQLTASHLPAESSLQIRKRVVRARLRQAKRYQELGVLTNAALTSAQIRTHLYLSGAAKNLLAKAAAKFCLSARSYFKIIKVAQTIADLQETPSTLIQTTHLAEALSYRRESFGRV